MKQPPHLPDSDPAPVFSRDFGANAWVRLERHASGRADCILQRPDRHNAFNDEVVTALSEAFTLLAEDTAARVVVLRSEGRHFSAGADLEWMRSQIDADFAGNVEDATRLARMLRLIDRCPKPVLVRVQGSAFGGALGLIACADVAIGDGHGHFCLSEVKLGLVPAVISPWVQRAIGPRWLRRYTLVADVFDAQQAQAIGLLHAIVPNEELDACVEQFVERLLANGPAAMMAAKQLLAQIEQHPLDEDLLGLTSRAIADRRVSAEGQEGMRAFLDKRRPDWPKHCPHTQGGLA